MILLFVLASGEEEAFAYLYSHYKGLMLQKAYAILHDRMLAEDAVSEAFLGFTGTATKWTIPHRTAACRS